MHRQLLLEGDGKEVRAVFEGGSLDGQTLSVQMAARWMTLDSGEFWELCSLKGNTNGDEDVAHYRLCERPAHLRDGNV